ncbi:MAG: hypothetical protein RBR38_10455 [Desulfomicrobium apsheronum]|nr:hypothetical protein [Desulfomicrobium apsheronum]
MNQSPTITTCDIDFSPLLELMRKDTNRGGMRAKDIAKQWGCSREKARELLGVAKEMGLVRPTRVAFTDLSGRDTTAPGYVLEVVQ